MPLPVTADYKAVNDVRLHKSFSHAKDHYFVISKHFLLITFAQIIEVSSLVKNHRLEEICNCQQTL